MESWLFCSLLVCAFALFGRAFANCPTSCACKWKGGKKAIECGEKGLITIPGPDNVDPETQLLDMSGNSLQILPRETFQRVGLINLQKLFLKSCSIGQIEDSAFRGLTNLIEIDLSDNLITYIPTHALSEATNLRTIIMSKNPIQKVDSFSFKSIPSLIKLDLSYCHIKSIGPKAFQGLDVLETLKLNENQLSELPINTVESLHRMRSIDLSGNNWKCDCRLRTARTWLSQYSINMLSPMFCRGGPDRLLDKSFTDLDPEDLACRPIITTDNRKVVAIKGTNATIECRVESDPLAKISWYSNGRYITNTTSFNYERRIFASESEGNIYDLRSKLQIRNVQNEDAGQYYCVAENRAGNIEANFTFTVTEAPAVALGSTNLNAITVVLAAVTAFMLIVIALLVNKLRHSSENDDLKSSKMDDQQRNTINNHNGKIHHREETSSENSDTRSDCDKAFTVTTNLSYSRSLTDVGNGPDLISSGRHIHPLHQNGICPAPMPMMRPISEFSQNWDATYQMPRTISYGHPMSDSGSDEVFSHSRMSTDYPPDYGLPILPENGPMQIQYPKNGWQKTGVPVYPPMCVTPVNHHRNLTARNSPYPTRSPAACGTDV